MNRVRGWFVHREWIELILAAVLLWLLMMVVIQGLDLRSVS